MLIYLISLQLLRFFDENKLDGPLFMPCRLDYLPCHKPEETNFFSFTDRIATMKHELAAVKIDVNCVKAGS